MGGKEMRPGKEGRNYLESKAALQEKILVPSKGLEPPHRCRYMDLNHARLPIPPRWQSELQCSGGPKAAVSGRPTSPFLQPCHRLSNHVLTTEVRSHGEKHRHCFFFSVSLCLCGE